MRRVIESTWLVVALFLIPVVALQLYARSAEFLLPGPGTLLAVTIVATAAIWWQLVARRGVLGLGRAAIAGAITAAVILLVPTLYMLSAGSLQKHRPGEGGVAGMAVMFLMIGFAVIGIPLGAGLGALAAVLQRRMVGVQRAS